MAKVLTGLMKPLADVNVLPQGDGTNKIVVCVQPDPNVLIGERESRAVIALDASRSIKEWYGEEGPFSAVPNRMKPIAAKLGEILCGLMKDDQVQYFYWAMGTGGDIEDIGTFKSSELADVDISGVEKHQWGRGTHLLPAIKAIVEGAGTSSRWVMGVILTDGVFEDEEACMEYCMGLGSFLKENPDVVIKLIIIGVGEEVDADQLVRFDDMFEGTELEEDVDIWSCCPIKDIQDEEGILNVLFGELMSEDIIVATAGKVVDADGNVIKHFTDGLPGKFDFMLPDTATSFTLQAGGKEVVQDLSDPLKRISNE